MYDELSAAWRFEIENTELGNLTPDFYSRVAGYLKKMKEETRMLDKKTLKMELLEHEMKNMKRMIREMVWIRYKKLIKTVTKDQRVPPGLALEEEAIWPVFLSFTENYQKFAKKLLQGKLFKMSVEKIRKRLVLRFLKDTPAIIGGDMKTYGPFIVEDVASLPAENAKILEKQGFAKLVEI